MAEDDKKTVGGSDDQSKGTESDDKDTRQKTYSELEYKELQSESVTRRKQIEGLETKLKAIEDEKLSDSEKKDKRVKDLEAEIEKMKNSDKATKIDAMIVEAMSDKNIIDKPAAKTLINKELESEEEITDKVVQKVVDKLLKDKPYLISTTQIDPSTGGFKKVDSAADKKPLEKLNDFVTGRSAVLK